MSTTLIPATMIVGNSVSAADVAYIFQSLTSTEFMLNLNGLICDHIALSAQSTSAFVYMDSLFLKSDWQSTVGTYPQYTSRNTIMNEAGLTADASNLYSLIEVSWNNSSLNRVVYSTLVSLQTGSSTYE